MGPDYVMTDRRLSSSKLAGFQSSLPGGEDGLFSRVRFLVRDDQIHYWGAPHLAGDLGPHSIGDISLGV